MANIYLPQRGLPFLCFTYKILCYDFKAGFIHKLNTANDTRLPFLCFTYKILCYDFKAGFIHKLNTANDTTFQSVLQDGLI